MLEGFIKAIQEKSKIRVHFYSKEDGGILTRTCAPMDYGPSRRSHQKNDKYHVWDYDSDQKMHSLSLNPEQIQKIEILDEKFDPIEFVTWDTQKSKWFVPRDWGKFS
jgi:hypothetical protein